MKVLLFGGTVEMINVKRKKIGEDMMMCIYIKIYKVMGKGRIVVCVEKRYKNIAGEKSEKK